MGTTPAEDSSMPQRRSSPFSVSLYLLSGTKLAEINRGLLLIYIALSSRGSSHGSHCAKRNTTTVQLVGGVPLGYFMLLFPDF